MATYDCDLYDVPGPYRTSGLQVAEFASASIEIASGDIVRCRKIPAGIKIMGWVFQIPEWDTNATPTLTVDFLLTDLLGVGSDITLIDGSALPGTAGTAKYPTAGASAPSTEELASYLAEMPLDESGTTPRWELRMVAATANATSAAGILRGHLVYVTL